MKNRLNLIFETITDILETKVDNPPKGQGPEDVSKRSGIRGRRAADRVQISTSGIALGDGVAIDPEIAQRIMQVIRNAEEEKYRSRFIKKEQG